MKSLKDELDNLLLNSPEKVEQKLTILKDLLGKYSPDIADSQKKDSAKFEWELPEQDKEKRLQNFIEGARLGTWEWHVRTDKAYFNRTWAAMLGYSPEELQPNTFETWKKILHTDDLPVAMQLLNDHLSGKTEMYSADLRMKHKDGSIVWVLAQGKVIERDASGKPLTISGTHTDITSRKLVEENLRLSEEKFKDVFDHSLIGKSFITVNGERTVNEAFCKMLGYTKSELLGKSWQELTPEEDIRADEKVLDLILTGQVEAKQGEKRYYHKNGSIVWVELRTKLHRNAAGEPLYLISIFNNITERKLTEQALKESEDRYKSIISISNTGAWEYHSDSDYVWCSPEYFSMLGRHHSEFDLSGTKNLDETWTALLHPEDRENAIQTFSEYLNNGSVGIYESYFRLQHRNGSWVWIWSRGQTLRDENGHVTRLTVGTHIDITRRKQAELLEQQHEELLAAKEKAELSAQLSREFSEKLNKAKEKAEENDALKTAFLQNISHEVRTPLNAIVGFSNMIKKPALSREKIDYFSSIILNSSQQLLATVTDILTISSLQTKQEKLNKNNVCINEMLHDLHTILKVQFSEPWVSLHLKTTLSDNLSEIFTDKAKIVQIITNLVSNAHKFTNEGTVEFGCQLKGNMLQFYVKDTGIGISPKNQSLIFERFHQADLSISKSYGGTGLGLSISKGFAELMGGEIWVESALNEGATFYFTVPYEPVRYTDDTVQNPVKANKKLNILVAEDIELNYLLLEEFFRDTNCNVVRAKNGIEAVEIAKSNKSLDAVLMDIKMPEMDGYTAAGLIKELYPDLPIIAQSGFPPDPGSEAINNYPFKKYLSKPINKNELFFALSKHIDIA